MQVRVPKEYDRLSPTQRKRIADFCRETTYQAIHAAEEMNQVDGQVCPFGGDAAGDCADCVYGCDYHCVNNECVQRKGINKEDAKDDVRTVVLWQGDCLALMKNIPDGSIDLVATDCPYHIVSGGCTNKGKGDGIFQKENASGGKLFEHNDIEFSEWLPEVYRVLKPATHCYIFCNGRNLAQLQSEAEKVGFVFQNTLVWDKGNVTPNRYYMGACEFILMFRKGKARTINNRGCSNILRVKNKVGKKYHPTEKPVDLMRVLI